MGEKIRDRKTLIYLNAKDLTQVEIEALGDMELGTCDNCGEIDSSMRLKWIDGEDFYDDAHCVALVASGMYSICDKCYERRIVYISLCGSCDKYFIVSEKGNKECPNCHSENLVYGCVEEIESGTFVIYNKINDLYWSNEYGWVNKKSATIFKKEEKQTIDLPIDGEIKENQ